MPMGGLEDLEVEENRSYLRKGRDGAKFLKRNDEINS